MMATTVRPVKGVSGISSSQFLHAFNHIWETARRKNLTMNDQNICIAVSGGSDSMALAFLCQQLGQYLSKNGMRNLSFQALIVDHQLRERSSLEAAKTQERLQKMGVHSQILKLEWPLETPPTRLPYVETQARRLRYQALGKACAQKGISKLCLGHHANDQAETVLMNLANSPVGRSIRTMASVAPIPECEGMHGIYRSGGLGRKEKRLSPLQLPNRHDLTSFKEAQSPAVNKRSPVCEMGGVDIFRPLLSFSKEQLWQTCIENGIKWEEDESNHDVRVAFRNTIRNLLSNFQLPRALQTPSLLRIASHEDSRTHELMRLRDEYLKRCKVIKFDTRSGLLVLRLPTDLFRHETFAPRPVAAELFKSLAEVVGPHDGIKLSALDQVMSAAYPRIEDVKAQKGDCTEDMSLSFVCGGVYIQRQRLKTATRVARGPSSPPYATGSGFEYVWSFSRQPFFANSWPGLCNFSPKDPANLREGGPLRPSAIGPTDQKSDQPELWSAWQLWDGRFWVRIRYATNRKFVVRAWNKGEIQQIRERLTPSKYKIFKKTCRDAAPGKVRGTLPVIAEIEDIVKQERRRQKPTTSTDLQKQIGEIVVFPTLGRAGWINLFEEDGSRKLDWEVRYKKNFLRDRKILESTTGYDPKNLIE